MDSPKIICNSSPLINLANIEQLGLIEPLYGKILIPSTVYQEVVGQKRGRDRAEQIEHLIKRGIIEVKAVRNSHLIEAFRKDLDAGESEVLALALEIKADLVILDEIDARRIADLHNIRKTGFVGILIKAKHQHLLKTVKDALDLAISKGFWIDNELYQHILAQLGER
jgi:predicted nucleic acid-binding protein